MSEMNRREFFAGALMAATVALPEVALAKPLGGYTICGVGTAAELNALLTELFNEAMKWHRNHALTG